MSDPAPAVPADPVAPANDANRPVTDTKFWADKSFLLVVLNIVAVLLAKKFGIELNTEQLAADAAMVLAYVAGNKAKTGMALKAEMTAWAKARYVAPSATLTLSETGLKLDAPPVQT